MRKLIKLNNIKKLKLNKFWAIMTLILVLIVLLNFQSKFILTHLDTSLKNLGFSLKEIIVEGIETLDESEIIEHVKYKNCKNLFCVNLKTTKNSLEKLDFVKKANIKLVFPSKLKIEIVEEKPRFLLVNGQKRYLLNSEGKVIANIEKKSESFSNLVILQGENVASKINDLKVILKHSPDLAKKVTSARLISNRRWSLVVSYYTTLDLPEKNPELAFKKLDSLNKKFGLLSDNLKIIDLRVKNRMIIKLKVDDNFYKESNV